MAGSTPRSGDERFFTPRSTARTGGYVSSEDEREEKFHTPGRGRIHSARSWTSDADYTTPRGGSSSEQDVMDQSYYESKHGGVPIVPMPFVASNDAYGRTAAASHSHYEGAAHAEQAAHADGYGAQSEYGAQAYGGSYQAHGDAGYDEYGGGGAYAGAEATHNSTSSAGASYGDGAADQYAAQNSSSTAFSEEDLANVFSFTRHNRSKDLERLLDKAGIPVNIRDRHGNTILIVACQNGLKRMAKLALRRGGDINARNYKGNTCLHFCYAYGYGDTLGKYLISKGADSSIQNNEGLLCFQGLVAQ